MHRIALFLLLMPALAQAQIDISVQGGLASYRLSPQSVNNYQYLRSGGSEPVFSIRATKPVYKRLELGAEISHQQYDVEVHTIHGSSLGMGLENTSRYIFISPLAGIAIGPMNIFRFYALPRFGLLYHGEERLGQHYRGTQSTLIGYGAGSQTGKNSAAVVFGIDLQAEQQMPISQRLRIVLNESYNFTINNITRTQLITETGSMGQVAIKPKAFAIKVGISYTIKKTPKAVSAIDSLKPDMPITEKEK